MCGCPVDSSGKGWGWQEYKKQKWGIGNEEKHRGRVRLNMQVQSLLGSLTEEMLKHQEVEERWDHHTDELWTEARAVKARTRRGHPGAGWRQGNYQQLNVVADTCCLVL